MTLRLPLLAVLSALSFSASAACSDPDRLASYASALFGAEGGSVSKASSFTVLFEGASHRIHELDLANGFILFVAADCSSTIVRSPEAAGGSLSDAPPPAAD